MNNLPNNFSQQAVTYNDIIYSKEFVGFNGFNNSIGAKIVVSVDPGGVIKPGNQIFEGAVPSKIQFFTANDDGKLYKAGEFDKAGRFITREHWSVTRNPSGFPLILMLNSDEPGNGPTLSLRRSRGTYSEAKAVKDQDTIFRITWYAHDGQSYKETNSIYSTIEGEVSIGNLPCSMIFKTFDRTAGIPTDSLKINPDKSVALKSLSSLDNTDITLNAPLTLKRVQDETERDLTITSPTPGTMIFVIDLDTVQVYTKTKGWKDLF